MPEYVFIAILAVQISTLVAQVAFSLRARAYSYLSGERAANERKANYALAANLSLLAVYFTARVLS